MLIASAVLGFSAAIGVIGYATLAQPAPGDPALSRSRVERAAFPQATRTADPNAQLRSAPAVPVQPVDAAPAPTGVPVADTQPAAPIAQVAAAEPAAASMHADEDRSDHVEREHDDGNGDD